MSGLHVASCSFGKDSLAMVLMLIEKQYPLDEVVFYDTGMEFDAIYRIRDKMLPILSDSGIKYTELYPENPFLYDMLVRPVYSAKKGHHNGYGWCGGVCRWGTTFKNQAIDKYVYSNPIEKSYIGIAVDEQKRLVRLNKPKCSPLAEWGMTESDCLAYCRGKGFTWIEKTAATESGYIDLYDILDRVSCWCCANKNRKELKNIYTYLPQYWDKLKDLQNHLDRPMKKFCNQKYGEYGNLFDMENVFARELEGV